jgi:hypothetical protein
MELSGASPLIDPASPILQARSQDCSPQTGIQLRIATFFVLSIFCHAATLHVAPGQRRRVVTARGIAMIFSPVTAGLYSLMSLGRMGVAWISILSRTFEVLAKINPQPETTQDAQGAQANPGPAVEQATPAAPDRETMEMRDIVPDLPESSGPTTPRFPLPRRT